MATKVTLKRGFKANAERLAEEYRKKLNIHPWSPLCAFKLAEHLSIKVYNATEIVTSSEHLNLLSGSNGYECEWSGLTMVTEAGNRIVIHNNYHSEARQQSNVMHELAHIICGHEHKEQEYEAALPLGMRSYNPEQEEEAKCLGGTLQLAKACLFWARKRSLTYEEIASHFSASVVMVKYRMNMTGIGKIYTAR